MKEPQIIQIETSRMKLNPKNPRKNDAAVDTVAMSIQQYGFKNPLIADSNLVVYCGNTRLKAARKLKLPTVPVIIADDLTPEQIREYALIDNKSGEIAEWDDDLLWQELDELDLSDFDLDWGAPVNKGEKEIIEDEPPEVEEESEAICKLGDVWQLGKHRLMCGDSTDNITVEKLMNGEKADMVFTDPPYGYEYKSNMRIKSKKFEVLKNDDKILDFIPALRNVCKGFIFVCTTWKVLDKWIPLFKKYYELSNMIIWNKGGGGIGDLEHTFSTDYEIILRSNNGAKITGKRIGSVWNIPKDNANDYIHATQKPVKLSATAIENTTSKDNIVLDVFGGSGSTLIACEQLGRRCFMMELDPKYCDVIIKRWENLTQQKAVKIHCAEETR
nr:MAG TPA: adenine specific DNA methyltransferase [Caudoviricetes sp.]